MFFMEHTQNETLDHAKLDRQQAIMSVQNEIESLENRRLQIESEILDLLHMEDAHDSEIERLELEKAGIGAQIQILGIGLEHGTVTADSVKHKKKRGEKRR